MKETTLMLVATFATICAMAQTKFWVYNNNGTRNEYLISNVDSISFTDPSSSHTSEKCKASDYAQVTIGTQTWMAENYRCSKYDTQSEAYNASWLTNNIISTSASCVFAPYYTDATDQNKWSSTMCVGYLDKDQIAKLGYMYNWAAAVGVADGSVQITEFSVPRQGVCPNGWHIPTKDDWHKLYDYIYDDQELSAYDVGKYLKTTSGWYRNDNGSDSYGFVALPSGAGAAGQSVEGVGEYAQFWTATPDGEYSGYAYTFYLTYQLDDLKSSGNDMGVGMSVRCLKN